MAIPEGYELVSNIPEGYEVVNDAPQPNAVPEKKDVKSIYESMKAKSPVEFDAGTMIGNVPSSAMGVASDIANTG